MSDSVPLSLLQAAPYWTSIDAACPSPNRINILSKSRNLDIVYEICFALISVLGESGASTGT